MWFFYVVVNFVFVLVLSHYVLLYSERSPCVGITTLSPMAALKYLERSLLRRDDDAVSNRCALGQRRHFATGIVNSAPLSIESDQRCMIDL